MYLYVPTGLSNGVTLQVYLTNDNLSGLDDAYHVDEGEFAFNGAYVVGSNAIYYPPALEGKWILLTVTLRGAESPIAYEHSPGVLNTTGAWDIATGESVLEYFNMNFSPSAPQPSPSNPLSIREIGWTDPDNVMLELTFIVQEAGAASPYEKIMYMVRPFIISGDQYNLDSMMGGKTAMGGAVSTTDSGIRIDGFVAGSLDAAITASTTQTQAGGYPIIAQWNNVTDVANDSDTVTLPKAIAGIDCWIRNSGANSPNNTLQIFPFSGDDLGQGADTARGVDVAVNGLAHYKAISDTVWIELS